MAYPYTVAMKHAMKVLLSSIVQPSQNSAALLKSNIASVLSTKELSQFSMAIERISKNGNIDEIIAEIKVILKKYEAYFDLFLMCLNLIIKVYIFVYDLKLK